MVDATQGDWGDMQQEDKVNKATEAWATARRAVKFTYDGKVPRANKKFYSTIAKTIDIALTFQTVNERLDPQEVQRLVLPNESSPEEDLEDSESMGHGVGRGIVGPRLGDRGPGIAGN